MVAIMKRVDVDHDGKHGSTSRCSLTRGEGAHFAVAPALVTWRVQALNHARILDALWKSPSRAWNVCFATYIATFLVS